MPPVHSPAVDTGDISLCAEVATDQRGYNRWYNTDSPCDLGAVEHDGVLLIYLPIVAQP
jgi:hypothetical protein